MANVAITGAGRGIALELVKLHLAKGDRVFALLRDPDGADALRGVAAGSGGKVTLHAMDVADDASVKAGAADTGDAAIDVLYNVAGVSGSTDSELESADFADWLDVFNVNVNGPMRVFQAFLPRLGSGAKVVSFGSQVGASTWPYPGYEAYSASKAALHRLMVSVALGTKDRGIIAISVHPGWVQTDMGGPGASLTVEDSARNLRNTLALADASANGTFLNHDGKPIAW
jgi:NAD(P)-dependent dehydrogenase (short-subunit alcohol dehydrogenase family)